MNNELQKHKTSDTVKWVLTLLAFILVGVMLAGIILGWFDKDDSKLEEAERNSIFTVIPQNNTSAMKLMAQSYSDGTAGDINESYTIIAETKNYDGEIDWSLNWTGNEVFWSSAEQPANASDCIKITLIDSRTVRTECLQPFGQQIEITAVLTDKPSIKAHCICDYKQKYEVDEIKIGFNSFLKDGSLGNTLISDLGIMPASVELLNTQALDYSCKTVSSSYTQVGAANYFPELSFTLTPNTEVIEAYGLNKYSFLSYTGSYGNALSGTVENFFDKNWGEYAIAGTNCTMTDFAEDLCNAVNELGFGIDSENLYTLTISGLPETDGSVCYGYKIDLYNLINSFNINSSISLNVSNLLFGGS